MKKHFILILTSILLTACAEEVIMTDSVARDASKKVAFSYDSVTVPSVWSTFGTFNEMMNACQIPDDVLKELPTDTLVALCVYHPLANTYLYHDNPMNGLRLFLDGFNGFEELKQRADCAEKIMDYYELIELSYSTEPTANKYSKHRLDMRPLQVAFIELLIASKEVPELYDAQNIGRLEQIANVKYEQKLQSNLYKTSFALSKSLLIGAQMKVTRSGVSNDKLAEFIDCGGMLQNAGEITEISKIIYAK